MIRSLAALIVMHACLATGLLSAQATSSRSPLEVRMEAPLQRVSTLPMFEPHLAIDPKNGKHLVVASMASRTPDLQDVACFVFASFDSGRTWNNTDFGERGPTSCGDVWTTIADDGSALVLYAGDSGIVVHRSIDGGRTWRDRPMRFPGSFDHPMFASGTPTADAPREIYIVSETSIGTPRGGRNAVFVARSTDNGMTFTERSRVVLTNVSQEAIAPVVLARGVIAFGTIDHHDSSNRRLERRRAWFAISTDSGATFSEPDLITESCTRTRFASWPSLAVAPAMRDSTGALRGPPRIFFTCEADGNRGILFAASTDRGNRWTAIRRIDGGPDSTWTKTPIMAVTPGGMLAVAWVDAREATHVETRATCFSLYGTVSRDGGATFSTPQKLSSKLACPTDAATGEGVMGRFPSGGEYFGLAASGTNEFMAVWPHAVDGRFQLHALRFAVRDM